MHSKHEAKISRLVTNAVKANKMELAGSSETLRGPLYKIRSFHDESQIETLTEYIYIVARMWRLYKTCIGLTTGFIGSQSVTHLQQLSLFCSSEDPGSNCCNQLQSPS
jgi:hypothetical protein